MDAEALRERWMARPRWQRWLGAYAAIVLAALLVGVVTPLGAGNAWFIAGALVILASLGFIRLGSHRKAIVHRDLDGRRLFKEHVISEERETQIQLGVRLFLLGLAVWALLLADYLWRR